MACTGHGTAGTKLMSFNLYWENLHNDFFAYLKDPFDRKSIYFKINLLRLND